MKIFKIVLILAFFALTVLIGSPLIYNCITINIAITFIGILFVLYLHFKKNDKIFTNKIDILVFILCVSPLIPILFNTYTSLTDSIVYFQKYISCFIIYLLSKHLVQYSNDSVHCNNILLKHCCMRNKDCITSIIIFSSIILCIFGIDNMTTKFFTSMLEYLNLPTIINLEGRMFSSLGYANSFAIILAINIILILDKIVNNKKYSGALFLNIACLLLTYSRAVLCFAILAIVAYILIDFNKKKTVTVMYMLFINITLSLLYIALWNKFQFKKSYLILWLITVILFAISIVIQHVFEKFYIKIEKISIRVYVILIVAILIIALIAIIIGLHLVTPLTIFQHATSNSTVKYKISNIKPNTDYSFKFEIDAKSSFNNKKNYSIILEEENKYYDKVDSHEISFNNFSGTKEINFKTSNDTIEIALLFLSDYKAAQQGLTVTSLTINENLHPLKYLYLPVNLVEKIKSINLNSKSVWERGTFYKDALKIAKNHIVFGNGANSWKYKYNNIQSYNYSSTEIHSYFLQVFVDYGIVTLIVLISILLLLVIRFFKCKNFNNLAIFIAFVLLLSHSFIDFDMSFFYIMAIAFTLLGILSSEDKPVKKLPMDKIPLITINISLIISIITIAILLIYTKRINLVNYSVIDDSNGLIEFIKTCRKTERYDLYDSLLEFIDYSLVSEQNMEYLYSNIAETPLQVNVQYIMHKNKIVENIFNTCNNAKIKSKFALLIINQHNQIISIIKDKEKNRLSSSQIEAYLFEQSLLYEKAKTLIL